VRHSNIFADVSTLDDLRHVPLSGLGHHRSGPLALQHSANAPNCPGPDPQSIKTELKSFFERLLPKQVGIPVLILPLLCAAYAEVDVEGKRLLKVPISITARV